ncbi:MAG: 6-carboxytetrahydropterin synthase [Gemmatimonadetes bacterium]|nr:6-carboxytetrahydropterin synthase [Gemmatimonadota bacterium]
MATSLTRRVCFRAHHHLWRADWSAAQNRAAFGALSESHPHEYTCDVSVSGAVDPVTGMLVDLVALDALLAREVTGALDGRDLNREVAPFASGRPIPTCEALAEHLFARIRAGLPAGVRLARVRVAEDATLGAECTGLA